MIRTTYEIRTTLKAPCLLCGWPMAWHAIGREGQDSHGCPAAADDRVVAACGSTSPSGARCVLRRGHKCSRTNVHHRDARGMTWSPTAARGAA